MYYYAGGSRAAMQVIDHAGGTSGVYNLYADHLDSTSVTADEAGLSTSELMYKAWGETRASTGDTPTDYRYTGQREEAGMGLYFYNARWYDPALGRFIQADSMVPNPGNPMDWDRYNLASLRFAPWCFSGKAARVKRFFNISLYMELTTFP